MSFQYYYNQFEIKYFCTLKKKLFAKKKQKYRKTKYAKIFINYH